ncbi:serine/threonine-protein kinase bud32 [Scheffersomyces spartinae]|uniref:EKC/KEOPS complex subunit BUD32 n=1 Tax=Scheffersomyces spartinae TaxID=45513 RepID=A0A9P7VCE6_9ASCO|nr:serine/threonine-protein kinase bud32 [Scheffersomyces spartinae]KAG7194754.1 serine/threonine-protein kinase bud32 [Scheffersomyces spartinae]
MTDLIVLQAKSYLPHIPLTVISQGAEAIVFETSVHPYCSKPSLRNQSKFIIKYRPPKPYRHPKIDASLTKSRTIGEAKFMALLARNGIPSPSLIAADFPHGIIWMEQLGGKLPNGEPSSLKNWLWYLERTNNASECVSEQVENICRQVGILIAHLHMSDMVHGDLTTSNIILEDGKPYLIDFGLSSYSSMAEDKAVDLYVMERAVLSTHSVYAEKYNFWILEGYLEAQRSSGDGKRSRNALVDTLRKLDDVRLRGRKRSMLG